MTSLATYHKYLRGRLKYAVPKRTKLFFPPAREFIHFFFPRTDFQFFFSCGKICNVLFSPTPHFCDYRIGIESPIITIPLFYDFYSVDFRSTVSYFFLRLFCLSFRGTYSSLCTWLFSPSFAWTYCRHYRTTGRNFHHRELHYDKVKILSVNHVMYTAWMAEITAFK